MFDNSYNGAAGTGITANKIVLHYLANNEPIPDSVSNNNNITNEPKPQTKDEMLASMIAVVEDKIRIENDTLVIPLRARRSKMKIVLSSGLACEYKGI